MKGIVLVLDAMGVIYESADDVTELLVPFIAENGGTSDVDTIQRAYIDASSGRIGARTFWKQVSVSPTLEDRYLERHRLTDDLHDFLQTLPSSVESLWCLSNDISDWSRKLRSHHRIEDHFAGFVISGDVGSRKPDVEIFQALLSRIDRPASDCIFVDDRVRNLDTAKLLGFRTILFGNSPPPHCVHPLVRNFSELTSNLLGLTSQ
jgi:HAD superfamily hydrolase (TIGR01509 family)